ncbi:MAG TPA: Tat pathway signal protein [Syntrophobacteraceae bacterium]|nr:Tat pathway signal protein [Syntrophobacteraceae bacterium]HBZ56839.1 Tat pathway signal protein [Syntrophobacteraceae bacterium]
MIEESDRPDNQCRREFLARATKAGLVVAAAGALGWWRYDSRGPGPSAEGQEEGRPLPDFSIPGMHGKMSIVHGEDRAGCVELALRALGGIETFIRPGDRVLVKVNAAFAVPAILCATTHPDLLRTVVRLCYQAGAASVVVTDNPINDPASCFALSGIGEATREAGARLVLPQERLFRPVSLPGGKLIQRWPVLAAPFQGITKVIGLAPAKDHHRSGASLTMKNWYGLLGGRRNMFHQDIHNIIKELALLIRPTLVVLDGTMTMMTNGPTGGSLSDLKATRTLIVSTDPVAADACGAELLGRKPADLPFILKAAAAGVGSADYESLKPMRATLG